MTETPLHVTGPSRIMLPAYAAHAVGLGLVYIIDAGGRLERVPGLAAARAMLPMRAWGLIFIALAAIMLAARFTERTTLLAWGLLAYGTAMILWAAVYLAALFVSPDASPAGPLWPLIVAAACMASARSVLTQGR